MSRLNLILLPCVLALALPAWAEGSPETAPGAQTRPLNLSLPRDVLQHAPGDNQPDEMVLRNLDTPAPSRNRSDAPSRPASLPYGAGYEHRQQEMSGTGTRNGGAAGTSRGTGRRGR